MCKKIVKSIKDFFKWKCPYTKTCDFYAEESETCQSPSAENGYCGQYRNQLKKHDQKEKK